MIQRITFLFGLLLMSIGLFAQSATDIARADLVQNAEQYGLKAADVSDVILLSSYQKQLTGASRIAFGQRYQGIEIYNAIQNYSVLPDGTISYIGKRFVADVANKVNTTTPGISAADAVLLAAANYGLSVGAAPRLIAQEGSVYRFEGGDYSNREIEAELSLQPTEDGSLRLAWNLALDMPTSADFWSVRVDAVDGAILHQNNYTTSCDLGHATGGYLGRHDHSAHEHTVHAPQFTFAPGDTAQYLVFPFPFESPIHGDQELLINPWDLEASPYGWHDTNGQDGPEFTITRGNNVHAFLDLDDSDASSGTEPDGGPNLEFLYPYDFDAEPETLRDAAQVQLFYSVNTIHDYLYKFGFDEAAGNFQQNNYGNGGIGNDYVEANAQDGGGINNANFATPPDGNTPRMQMFLWNAGSASGLLRVDEPAILGGFLETAGQTQAGTDPWGALITTDPVTGVLVNAQDGVDNPFETDICEPIINTDEVEGKIALIDRGGCEFGAKALRAQDAGAIGAIICNFEDNIIGMAPGAVGAQVTIPVTMVSSVTCEFLRTTMQSEEVVVSFVTDEYDGPSQLDGDFDTGVVAHEFGHGVSNRLTGTPGNTGCLGNAEQMGEGWSDFMTLIIGVEEGDMPEDRRGVGVWVNNEGVDGQGIRTYPYSTDMAVNPFTYEDINGSTSVHFVGSVWATMLWDMYWALVDEHGFDLDPTNMTAGNNIAIRLVMDGMAIQPCNPGFVDGRDAILAADMELTGGDNQCLIWEAFARRGLGFFAEQGSSDSTGDQTENFDPRPTCIAELKIDKSVTELVEAGNEITVKLTVTNHKDEEVTGVTVTDIIPDGTTFVPGSANMTPNFDGNMVSFDLTDIEYDVPTEITYNLLTDESAFSITEVFDPATENDNWVEDILGDVIAINLFELQDAIVFSEPSAWFVQDIETESQQVLMYDQTITVPTNNPVLRFYHDYDTQAGFDGGFVQVTTNDGANWKRLRTQFFRNGYSTTLSYQTFVIPFLEAFSGDSEGFVGSYADLSEYAGQDIKVRFVFGSDETVGGLGWAIDNFEIMQMLNYNTEACITSDQGDNVCAEAESRGTIMESQLISGTNDPISGVSMSVFPNPADEVLYLNVQSENSTDVQVRLLSVDGRLVAQQELNLNGISTTPLTIADLPAGFYFVELRNDSGVLTQKVVID